MPTHHYCEQGSEQWLTLRLAIPTASEFHRIVTPTGRLSKQSRAYAIKLVAEKLLNRQLESFEETEWMERGRQLEFEAVKAFEFETDLTTKQIGIIISDCGRYGASPDRLVGEDGVLEIKCPAPHTHLGYLLDGFNADYRPQVQGQLLVSGRDWYDWISYSPEMPMVRVRAPRDPEYIGKLRAALDEFCDEKDSIEDYVRKLGLFAAPRHTLTAAATAYADLGRLLPGEIA